MLNNHEENIRSQLWLCSPWFQLEIFAASQVLLLVYKLGVGKHTYARSLYSERFITA